MPKPALISSCVGTCSMGSAPTTLTVISTSQVNAGGKPVANVNNDSPSEIAPCGMCSSLQNPAVANLTSMNQGVLTPAPCNPKFLPMEPGKPNVLVGGKPMANIGSMAKCTIGQGCVTFSPAQTSVM